MVVVPKVVLVITLVGSFLSVDTLPSLRRVRSRRKRSGPLFSAYARRGYITNGERRV